MLDFVNGAHKLRSLNCSLEPTKLKRALLLLFSTECNSSVVLSIDFTADAMVAEPLAQWSSSSMICAAPNCILVLCACSSIFMMCVALENGSSVEAGSDSECLQLSWRRL